MKILLIDDDKFFHNFYAVKLKEEGYEVEVASDGAEGLDKIATFGPDVILLDLIMPKKDGFEFLQEIQKNATYKAIPIVVFSTLGDQPDVERALQLGAKDFVNKSFLDFDGLKAKIAKYALPGATPAVKPVQSVPVTQPSSPASTPAGTAPAQTPVQPKS